MAESSVSQESSGELPETPESKPVVTVDEKDYGSIPKFEKLDKSNYRTWRSNIMDFIESKMLWEVVEIEPVTLKGRDPYYRVKNGYVKSLIKTNYTPAQAAHIAEVESAYDVWKTLERVHKGQGTAYLMSLYTQFFEYSPSEDESIDSVSTELSRIQLEIANITSDGKLPDFVKTHKLLTIYRSREATKGRVEVLLSGEKSPDYLTVVNRLKECLDATKEKGKAKFTRDKEKRRSKGSNQNMQCTHCGRKGHTSNACWQWLATDEGRQYLEQKVKNHDTKGNGAGGNKNKFKKPQGQVKKVMEADSESEIETAWIAKDHRHKCTKDQKWYIDSCASRHMSWDRSIFASLDHSAQLELEAAEGTLVTSAGRGDAVISVDGGKIRLKDIHYVPQLTSNLLSVSQFQDRGFELNVLKDGTINLICNGEIEAQGERHNRVYIMNKVLVKGTMRAFCITEKLLENPDEDQLTGEDYDRLWHRRLTHIGHPHTAELHKYVKGLRKPISPLKKGALCDPCAQAKHLRIINKTAPTRVKEKLGRVSTDFWGPYYIPTLNGERYMLTFTDHYSRKSWVYLVKERTELRTLFMQWRAYTELQSGEKLKILRCDNAKEFKSLGAELKEGVAMEDTVHYTPEQNGIAERLNRMLITLARVMIIDAGVPQKL
jgi:hypothetical protein